jgi:hypothetical protein
LRGDKQDNMVESPDFLDPQLGHSGLQPVRRRPAADPRDARHVRRAAGRPAGPRLPHLTFITTLRYVLEAAAEHGKSVWVLDRPNPIGRPVEGTRCARAGRASSVPVKCRCDTASRSAKWAAGSSGDRLDVDYR